MKKENERKQEEKGGLVIDHVLGNKDSRKKVNRMKVEERVGRIHIRIINQSRYG